MIIIVWHTRENWGGYYIALLPESWPGYPDWWEDQYFGHLKILVESSGFQHNVDKVLDYFLWYCVRFFLFSQSTVSLIYQCWKYVQFIYLTADGHLGVLWYFCVCVCVMNMTFGGHKQLFLLVIFLEVKLPDHRIRVHLVSLDNNSFLK